MGPVRKNPNQKNFHMPLFAQNPSPNFENWDWDFLKFEKEEALF